MENPKFSPSSSSSADNTTVQQVKTKQQGEMSDKGVQVDQPDSSPSSDTRPNKKRSSLVSQISLRSDSSRIQPFNLSPFPVSKRVRRDQPDSSPSPDTRPNRKRSSSVSQISLRSDSSRIQPFNFRPFPVSKREATTDRLFEEILKCSVCADYLKDPVSTSCGHTYCRPCISTYQAKSEYGENSCPKCGKTSGSCSVLHPNRMLAELLEKLKVTHSAGITESGEMELRLCPKHHEALAMFCITDETAICKECAVLDHRDHEKQYIKILTVPDTLTTLQNLLSNMTATEFREFKIHLSSEYPECFDTLQDDCSAQQLAKRMMGSFSKDDVLKVTFQLASVKPMFRGQEKIKKKLRQRFRHIHEGLGVPKTQAVLHDIYTELYITEGGSDTNENEHEIRLIEKIDKNFSTQETPVSVTDIFKSPSEPREFKTVLTKGVAGIGKTVSVQKFILDWAENKENQHIDLILPLFFRDLNLERQDCSLKELLQRYFPELKDMESLENGIKILIILDGLDECRLPLDFQQAKKCCDITETTSIDVIVANLINGNLLQNAFLWITSRPAATNQIPSEYIQRVTEVRGFKNDKKEEYFKRKYTNLDLADTIIKHVKSSRSLHTMCHIPIFCWIMATVLEVLLKEEDLGEIPKNLTQLYTHFLLIQIGLKNRKYQKAINEDLRKLSKSDKEMILRLAKLAFQGVEKNHIIFYEDDLKECGIDIDDAVEFSSLCTQLFREEFGLYTKKVFCFLHLSVQEHLAAVHVLCTYLNEGINVLASHAGKSTAQAKPTALMDVLKSAVNKALKSKNGHFDQFLRFLLGLSTKCNQKLLRGILPHSGTELHNNQEIVEFIKVKIGEKNRSESETINLFHCLNEIDHNDLVNDIQESLQSGTLAEKELNPEQCSALAFVLLISEDILNVFDLRKYKTKESSRQRLLPVIRASKKAILSDCKLSANACETVASALRTANSPVTELDLSHNNIEDSGVRHLCKGLQSPHCQLQILSLAACKITTKSCGNLASALKSIDSSLQELDLSVNNLTDSGVNMLEPWLKSDQCKVQKLRLRQCSLTENYCRSLAEELTTSIKQMDLDLKENDLKD
ncbi:NLR family CARD domain-containing protein 3-like [Trichomycterus rosablanca]|uniref:NLR family CARD domain-containing protein 3-like n=1 Tax=Trichomycterus rosablanca TaxID=2290929 RepID=UPI002F357E20